MALKLNERYPGRFDNPTTAYPQGAFKNRSAPGAQDGSYLEKDWANDVLGFLSHLLVSAGITPNGNVDTALASQYYDALNAIFISGTAPISRGGTGATTAPAARTSLGLGTASVANVGTGVGQIPDMSSFTATLGNPTVFRFPNGMIIQTGTTNITSGNQTITLPVTFPNAHISAWGTINPDLSATNIEIVQAWPASNSTLRLQNAFISGSTIGPITSGLVVWGCIGY